MNDDLKPTDEQTAVIDAFSSGENLKVIAVAGSGKTTTLRMAANTRAAERNGWRGLYATFSKPLQIEAAQSFPGSVDCKTSHALAFRSHGAPMKHRFDGPRLSGKDSAEIMWAGGRYPETRILNSPVEIAPDVILHPSQLARLALDTVKKFTQSADDEIGAQHVPTRPGLEEPQWRAVIAEIVVPVARLAWRDLTHPAGRLTYFQDCYIKAWALSRPRIRASSILFDEAQDANACLSAVLRAQTHAQLVAVGDPYQQLFAWRGAVDALATWPADKSLTLAQSFRFGEPVAHRANAWLELLGAPTRVLGWPEITSTVGAIDEPTAILCRSNAGAMGAVIRELDAGRRVHLVGGTSDIERLAKAAQRLQAGERVDHPDLMAFKSWDEVRQHAEQESDGSLAVLVKLIDEHGPDRIVSISGALSDERMAEVTVSTAHKSKGRQWSKVQLGPDFREPFPREDPRRPGRYRVVVDASEAMLLYVASTRAVDALDDTSARWVEQLHDYGLPVVVRGAPRVVDAAPEPNSPAERREFAQLLDASSLGSPEAKRLRETPPTPISGELTGMADEQTDWDGTPAPVEVPHCWRCGLHDCFCDPETAARHADMIQAPCGPREARAAFIADRRYVRETKTWQKFPGLDWDPTWDPALEEVSGGK